MAGAQWTFVAHSGDRPFLTIINEQTAVLGLGAGWRENHDEPPWRVEIDGEPPIIATFGWPEGVEPGAANSLLNVSRAMNTIPRLVEAPPGCVSVLDFPAVVAAPIHRQCTGASAASRLDVTLGKRQSYEPRWRRSTIPMRIDARRNYR